MNNSPRYQIFVHYQGYFDDPDLETTLRRAVAGVAFSGSGYDFMTGERDISFQTNHTSTAVSVVKRLRQALRTAKRRGRVTVFDTVKDAFVRLY